MCDADSVIVYGALIFITSFTYRSVHVIFMMKSTFEGTVNHRFLNILLNNSMQTGCKPQNFTKGKIKWH